MKKKKGFEDTCISYRNRFYFLKIPYHHVRFQMCHNEDHFTKKKKRIVRNFGTFLGTEFIQLIKKKIINGHTHKSKKLLGDVYRRTRVCSKELNVHIKKEKRDKQLSISNRNLL